jgi:hypothetical protein
MEWGRANHYYHRHLKDALPDRALNALREAGTVPVSAGKVGPFRALSGRCGIDLTRPKILAAQGFQRTYNVHSIGSLPGFESPPSARKFQHLRTHFSLWPPFGRFVNEGSSPPRSVRAVEPLNGIVVGQR